MLGYNGDLIAPIDRKNPLVIPEGTSYEIYPSVGNIDAAINRITPSRMDNEEHTSVPPSIPDNRPHPYYEVNKFADQLSYNALIGKINAVFGTMYVGAEYNERWTSLYDYFG